jgi:hypothetical protein
MASPILWQKVVPALQKLRYQAYEKVVSTLPPDLAASCDWRLVPSFRAPWGGAFNGQAKRIEIFEDLVRAIPIEVVVETGSYRGTTTAFLRERTRLPVFTVESQSRYFHYCKRRFRDDGQVHVRLGDSRNFLEALSGDPAVPKQRVLFYLDAHWNADLPLAEELQLIARRWTDSVILIDDFQVPGDSAYGFDDYGPGKRLCRDYLPADALRAFNVFWPKAPGAQESGARRGCVVLASNSLASQVAALATLRADA